MNKRKIVKEIINPYMDKNGFTLEKYERGDWSYRKKIDEALLEINIADANGRLHMHIGVYGVHTMYRQSSLLIHCHLRGQA